MSTENTSLKNTTPTGDSNTTNEMVMGKITNYQRTFLIVAGSLLALLVWIAATGKNGGPLFKSSTHEITKGASALLDYQADPANSALKNDVFISYESDEEGNGKSNGKKARELKHKKQKNYKKSKNQKGTKQLTTDISDMVAVSENDDEGETTPQFCPLGRCPNCNRCRDLICLCRNLCGCDIPCCSF